MVRGLMFTLAPLLVAHGLIHLMGAAVYLRLTTIEGLPFKTALLWGRWEIGAAGMRLFGLLWLLPAIAFVIATFGMLQQTAWRAPLLTGAAIASLLLTLLDGRVAIMGAVANVIILLALALLSRIAG